MILVGKRGEKEQGARENNIFDLLDPGAFRDKLHLDLQQKILWLPLGMYILAQATIMAAFDQKSKQQAMPAIFGQPITATEKFRHLFSSF